MAKFKTRADVQHLDAGETAFFKRQLEFVKSKTYDTKYKNLKAMMFLPVSTEANPGDDYIVWYSFSKAGKAKIISDYAHDFPRVDVYAEENQSKIKSIGASYGYSTKEIRRAAKAGNKLNTRRANTARRAIEEEIDDIAWNGNEDFNLQGFLNYPGITEYTVPNDGTGSSTLWSSKTAALIIRDMTGLLNSVSVPTYGKEEIDQILLPREQYNLIKTTEMSAGSDYTILKFFLETNPGVSVDILDELDGAGDGGLDRMVGYVRDPEHLTLEIPQPFEQLEYDKKGMEYEIPCHAECGGVIIYYPQSVAFGDGI
ncbi:MAG: DUF2184 domain-containing protein [Nitrosopumilaceae archaeon]